jgi:lysophospholipase L1-like esterase
MKSTIKTYLMIIWLSVLASALLSEAYLRWYFRDPERLHVLPPNTQTIYAPTPGGTPGVSGPSHFRTNSLGLRGDDPLPDAKRVILVFGGSTSIDVWLDQPHAWTQVLQDTLNREPGQPKTWVGNVSKWGLSTIHNLIHFHDVEPYLPKPNVVIVLAGGNDMQRALLTSYPKEITPENERELAYDYAPPHDNAFLSSFGFYRLYVRLREVRRKEALGKALGGNADGLIPAHECRQKQRAEDLVRTYPNISNGLADFRRNLNKLVDLSEARGAQVILATQPAIWQKDMSAEDKKNLVIGGLAPLADWSKCGSVKYYAPEVLADALERFDDVTRDICSARHLRCVDLDREIPKSARYFFDDVHFDDAGAALTGKLIAKAVTELPGSSMTKASQ